MYTRTLRSSYFFCLDDNDADVDDVDVDVDDDDDDDDAAVCARWRLRLRDVRPSGLKNALNEAASLSFVVARRACVENTRL